MDMIDKALEILTELSANEEIRKEYFERQQALLEEEMAFNKTKEDARKKGRQEGEEEIAKEIAVALLDVLEDEIIALKTGLDIEVVQNLRKVNNSQQG